MQAVALCWCVMGLFNEEELLVDGEMEYHRWRQSGGLTRGVSKSVTNVKVMGSSCTEMRLVLIFPEFLVERGITKA